MLALIVPLYNEETSLPRLFHELARLRVSLEEQLSVVMVDDASTDATGMLLSTQAKESWITVVRSTKRRGQHQALFLGLEEALRVDHVRVVGTMDADMDPPPEEFMNLLPYVMEHDLVIAQRKKRSRSLLRRAASFALLVLSWILRPTRIHDHGSMFRLYTVDLCRRCLHLRAHGEFLAGVSLLAAKNPVEVPVRGASPVVRSSRYSNQAVFEAGIQMLRLLIRHPFGLFRNAE